MDKIWVYLGNYFNNLKVTGKSAGFPTFLAGNLSQISLTPQQNSMMFLQLARKMCLQRHLKNSDVIPCIGKKLGKCFLSTDHSWSGEFSWRLSSTNWATTPMSWAQFTLVPTVDVGCCCWWWCWSWCGGGVKSHTSQAQDRLVGLPKADKYCIWKIHKFVDAFSSIIPSSSCCVLRGHEQHLRRRVAGLGLLHVTAAATKKAMVDWGWLSVSQWLQPSCKIY